MNISRSRIWSLQSSQVSVILHSNFLFLSKYEIRFVVYLEPSLRSSRDISVPACLAYWILPTDIVEAGLKGLRNDYTIKIPFVCQVVIGKSWYRVDFGSGIMILIRAAFFSFPLSRILTKCTIRVDIRKSGMPCDERKE